MSNNVECLWAMVGHGMQRSLRVLHTIDNIDSRKESNTMRRTKGFLMYLKWTGKTWLLTSAVWTISANALNL
jgi:hypothetical protein